MDILLEDQMDFVKHRLEVAHNGSISEKHRFIRSAKKLIYMLNHKILENSPPCIHEGQCEKMLTREEMIVKAKAQGLIR